MHKLVIGVLIAGSLASLSGCGGSSNSKLSYSAFSDAANKICTSVNHQSNAVGGATDVANAANATKIDELVSISKKGLAELQALSGPSSTESARDTFVAQINKATGLANKASAAAKAGNQAAYTAAGNALGSGEQQSNIDGSKLGAPACASST